MGMNPARAGPLVLENLHQKFEDANAFKAHCKKFPDFVMKQYSDCWTLIGGLNCGVAADKSFMLNCKALKGKVVLLWPCHWKGAPDPKQSHQHAGKAVAKELKTTITDSYS